MSMSLSHTSSHTLCYNLNMKRKIRHKNNLSEYIIKNGFNQTSFARYLNIPRKTLVEYCIGRNLPKNEMARKIAEELNEDLLAIWPEYYFVQGALRKRKKLPK